MSAAPVKFSICIPAYNRARHLAALLDSIYAQDCRDFEIVICEDVSPERQQIAAIARDYAGRYPGTLRYCENETNFGYDGNIRRLVEQASGEFCFFMGNDDLMCPGALSTVAALLQRHNNVGLVLKSYAFFDEVPEKINEEIRYFSEEREFAAGAEAIRVCFRRSGVISGYIVHRDSAHAVATSRFDGTLYYQMHLTANVLATRCAVFTPTVLVHCRLTPPEFGSSDTEKGKYVPGHYTPEARLRMISGALSIVKDLKQSTGIDVVDDVTHDYTNYFYPYIRISETSLGCPSETSCASTGDTAEWASTSTRCSIFIVLPGICWVPGISTGYPGTSEAFWVEARSSVWASPCRANDLTKFESRSEKWPMGNAITRLVGVSNA